MTALIIYGCVSNVGKSMIVAGLCRAARLRGLSVAPFKPQNMSNNAAVTVDGGEIGRSGPAGHGLRVGAAYGHDPVLLKPETDSDRRWSFRAGASRRSRRGTMRR